ncbi:MAG: DUF2461 domain-containing protein [Micrococcales bacterium]|nr:DUF2461 domain-containing protein [Micrococcales bacterium]
MSDFAGFSPETLDFYASLERHNSRETWQAGKGRYAAVVRQPIESLLALLEPDFGAGHVFRPNRDVRFSADKSPYKTHQGAYCATPDKAYYYVQVDADGLLVGAGGYRLATDQLALYRAAAADDLAGPELERILAELAQEGFEPGGEQLKSRPRGIPADHPRLELLRHKSLHVSCEFGSPDWLFTPEVADRVRDAWDALRPFTGWLDQHVGASELPRR